MKKIILILFTLLFFSKVEARCLTNELQNLKSIVRNINYTYDYYIEGDNAYFNIILSNLIDEIYIVDNYNNRYYYNNTINGELFVFGYSNNASFDFYSIKCDNEKVGNINIKFPIYNKFYKEDICSNYNKYNWCKKWGNRLYTENEINNFIENMNKKGNPEKIIEDENADAFDIINSYYVKYYYFILPIIIIVGIILIIIVNKKQKFKLLD